MKHEGCLVEQDMLSKSVAKIGALNMLADNSSMRTDNAILSNSLYLSLSIYLSWY